MNLTDFLRPEMIQLDVRANDKWEIIEKIIQLFSKSPSVADLEDLRASMIDREKTMTTGIGHGIAIPHANGKCIHSIDIASIILHNPVDFESFDMKPVSIVFGIISPEDGEKKYMTLLSNIARIFSHNARIEDFIDLKTPADFINKLRSHE